MSFSKLFAAAIASFTLALVLIPLGVIAHTSGCNTGWGNWGYNSQNCPTTPTTGSLMVYVQVINQYNNTYSPSNFTVAVSGVNPTPQSFQGSINGTQVQLGGGSYNVTITGNPTNATPSYSQGCNNTIVNGQSQTCVITMSGSSSYYPYPTPYPYPYTNPTLSCSPSYQTVGINQSATFVATGGNGTYNWATASRTHLNVGPTLNTVFQTTGTQTVVVTSGALSAVCTVNITSTGGPVVYSGTSNNTIYSYPSYTTPTYTYSYVAAPRLPNTGFEPVDAKVLAYALVVLLGSMYFAAPYVRKAFAVALG